MMMWRRYLRRELERFKRSMATVGKFAHSMHEAAGAPVRGVQGRVLAARTAADAKRSAERR